MKRVAWLAGAALILVSHSAGAEPTDVLQPGLFFNLDFGVREQRAELHFGARLDTRNTLRRQLALRVVDEETPAPEARTEPGPAPARWSTPGLLQLDFSARHDFILSASGLPLAGYSHMLRADGTESGQGGWFARNWGWTLAGAAAVAGIAVAAGGGHISSNANTQNANQCQVTVVGSPPTNTSGCPKSSAGGGR